MSSDHPAVRSIVRSQDAAVARDWSALADCLAEDFRYEDRRAGLQSSGGKAENIGQLRVVAELGLSRIEWETIETRGERFALGLITFHVNDFTAAMLAISVVDDDGRSVIGILFDDDSLDAARSEFEALSAGSDPP